MATPYGRGAQKSNHVHGNLKIEEDAHSGAAGAKAGNGHGPVEAEDVVVNHHVDNEAMMWVGHGPGRNRGELAVEHQASKLRTQPHKCDGAHRRGGAPDLFGVCVHFGLRNWRRGCRRSRVRQCFAMPRSNHDLV